MWVTYRYALQDYGLTHEQIIQLASIVVHAPNGIKWKVYKLEVTE